MGFDASRAALRFGYATMKQWLGTKGQVFIRRFSAGRAPEQATA